MLLLLLLLLRRRRRRLLLLRGLHVARVLEGVRYLLPREEKAEHTANKNRRDQLASQVSEQNGGKTPKEKRNPAQRAVGVAKLKNFERGSRNTHRRGCWLGSSDVVRRRSNRHWRRLLVVHRLKLLAIVHRLLRHGGHLRGGLPVVRLQRQGNVQQRQQRNGDLPQRAPSKLSQLYTIPAVKFVCVCVCVCARARARARVRVFFSSFVATVPPTKAIHKYSLSCRVFRGLHFAVYFFVRLKSKPTGVTQEGNTGAYISFFFFISCPNFSSCGASLNIRLYFYREKGTVVSLSISLSRRR